MWKPGIQLPTLSFWKDLTTWPYNMNPMHHDLTIMGYCLVLKQLGDKYAFLFLVSIMAKLSGSASTRSPLQLRWRSKYKVLDRVSPSKAPHSTKKPPVCKNTQLNFEVNFFKLNMNNKMLHSNVCTMFMLLFCTDVLEEHNASILRAGITSPHAVSTH